MDRRRFLGTALGLPALASLGPLWSRSEHWELHRESSVLASLKAGASLPSGSPTLSGKPSGPTTLYERFQDLDRHFVFDYYPWYGRDPWRHWNAAERRPPEELATNYLPRLGAYDSRDRRTIEQHAQWIAWSGAGAISISWWGRGSYEDAAVHLVMDVMRDHGIAVTFGLEPYADDRGYRFESDVLYLLREYGERRGWDAFLILRNEDGTEGPVFKGFRCILPDAVIDCHGVRRRVPDYTADAVWRGQTDRLREKLRWDFDQITLLADSLNFGRTPASGFDGIAIYDNFIAPEQYAPLAQGASDAGLLFSFNVNPGYDEILLRDVPPDSCYEPRPFVPPAELDFERAEERERAAALSAQRVRTSLDATVSVQSDSELTNFRRGFFLVYANSFNEWHEGHAFEPMKDDVELSAAEQALNYRNPRYGDYRLMTLSQELRSIFAPIQLEPGRRV
jgi:hypothetical protein